LTRPGKGGFAFASSDASATVTAHDSTGSFHFSWLGMQIRIKKNPVGFFCGDGRAASEETQTGASQFLFPASK
jgi:hypothetical protein